MEYNIRTASKTEYPHSSALPLWMAPSPQRVVYEIPFSCGKVYTGETKGALKIRMKELHSAACPVTRRNQDFGRKETQLLRDVQVVLPWTLPRHIKDALHICLRQDSQRGREAWGRIFLNTQMHSIKHWDARNGSVVMLCYVISCRLVRGCGLNNIRPARIL